MPGCVKSNAFTLVEIIVAIAVFAVALTALIVAFNPAATGTANPIMQARAAELGQAYLEEIRGKRFDENNGVGSQTRCGDGVALPCSSIGADGGETRANYDDVDDYDGLTEAPTDALGNTRDNYSAGSYSVSVTVSYAGADLGLANTDAKRIDVTVTGPQNNAYNFSTYRTNF